MEHPDETTSLIDEFPKGRLTREREDVLAGGGEESQIELVMHSMREALLYTTRVCRNQIGTQDRVSLCYQELMMSARRFKPGRVRFFAFAKAGLRGRMKTFFTSLKTVRNAGEISSVDALGGWVRTPVHQCEDRVSFRAQEDESASVSVRERITGEIVHPEFDQIFARDEWSEVEKLVATKLTERQRMVLAMVYKSGLNFPQIGKLLGYTRSFVHAIHRDALKVMRGELASSGRLLSR